MGDAFRKFESSRFWLCSDLAPRLRKVLDELEPKCDAPAGVLCDPEEECFVCELRAIVAACEAQPALKGPYVPGTKKGGTFVKPEDVSKVQKRS